MSKSFIAFILLLSTSGYGQDHVNHSLKKIKPNLIAVLSDSIAETSGLLAFDGLLWTHNDDRDTTLYGLDTLGKIKIKVVLPTVSNQDWEAITQDDNYLYVGDFGNNSSGNRANLEILKIDKLSFYTSSPKIERIHFSYENQTDFSAKKGNLTNFDCEAFIVKDDSIYLFTKEWKKQKSTVYVLPNSTGTHIAKPRVSLAVKGLVTDACLTPDQKTVVLCGYSKSGKPFLYVLSDFNNTDFGSARKRRIKLKLPFHQLEGISTFDGLRFYLTNEKLVRKLIINVQQKMHKVDLSKL